MADLYPRLDRKQQGVLLQFLTKRIIVDAHGEIIEHELNVPIVDFRSLVQGFSTPGNGKGGSEHVPLGAQKFISCDGLFFKRLKRFE
jgi:hypothetical protein